MPFTYKWSDLILLAGKNVRNIPTTAVDALHCDLVSSKMASVLPWRPLQTTIALGTLPLVNGQQDYSVSPNISSIVSARLSRTDVSPIWDVELFVNKTIAVNNIPVSPYSIRKIAHQPGEGLFRLECAVQIPSGQTWEIRGDVEQNPTKVTATSQGCWFDDKYANVAMDGLLYWMYKIAGDTQAGSAATDGMGRVTYSGQLGIFFAELREMAKSEDLKGGDMNLFPAEPLSEGRNGANISYIFGF